MNSRTVGCGSIPVSVVIPVKNEEDNLDTCLSRLGAFSEVVVVDSNSTDATQHIADRHGCKFVQFQWNGKYPKKRNWYLENHGVQNDWVLFLDADEQVTPEFCRALVTALAQTRHSGFWLNYTIYFLGKRLNYGVPQRKLALFRADRGTYERIDEGNWSNLDMEVHEHPIVDGSVGEIDEKIDHKDNSSLESFVERHRQYSIWEARRAMELRNCGEADAGQLTGRQKLKYRYLDVWWFPYAYFIYQYFVRLGFLDGVAGLRYAGYKFWYFNRTRKLMKTL